MTEQPHEGHGQRYPLSMRILHWLRAALILGLLASGLYMTRLPENDLTTSSLLYPNHKQFGILVWLLALIHLGLRWRHGAAIPGAPAHLAPWEKWLSHLVHRLIIMLTLITPVLGYPMSSSFTQSDGVPFFFLSGIPELLPKNNAAFVVFELLHRYSAYALLCCILLHLMGAMKHRLEDREGDADVLRRML
ncbi:cytochrome b [Rhizobium sp. BR 314]|uniref:cytochrome b n=1 Tax=Rhizobium sp. BR 314 TaxID=3040013 RepID=UPI0039BF4DC0